MRAQLWPPGRLWIAIALGASTLASCSGDDGAVTAVSTAGAASTAPAPPPSGAPVAESIEAGEQPASTTTLAAAPAFEPAPIAWEPFEDGLDVATLEVPVDYADPTGPLIELALVRYQALDPEQRIGSLLVNPGGPGFGGSELALGAEQIFDRVLRERFDIIGWDPRGTGDSVPAIDCIDDYDQYVTSVDRTPASPEAASQVVTLNEEFAAACDARLDVPLDRFGTNSSARDMDAIRRALGEEKISFFGFSYGSELGATWATLFPATVRAIVIDGAADPSADEREALRQQMTAFEASLARFLARCSADDDCAFHNDGDAEAAFDALMTQLDAAPVVADPSRPPVNRDVALTGVALAMYSEDFWPVLAESLAAALAGDAGGLLEFFDGYYQRLPDGTWGNELEAFQVISCADSDERADVAEEDARAADLSEIAPRFVPAGSLGGYFCTFFTPSTDPRVAVTGAGAGPVLVIGTTGDPATPLESTRLMRDALEDGRLVVVDAEQHTGYGLNDCVIEVVNDYLIDLVPPADETTCS